MRALADLTVTITESFPADYLHALTVEDVLASIAAPYAADFDLAAAEDDYRDALAANLAPLGVNVVGDALTCSAAAWPVLDCEAIAAAIADTDAWGALADHDLAA